MKTEEIDKKIKELMKGVKLFITLSILAAVAFILANDVAAAAGAVGCLILAYMHVMEIDILKALKNVCKEKKKRGESK